MRLKTKGARHKDKTQATSHKYDNHSHGEIEHKTDALCVA